MYERILVPTDGSAGARVAFDHALALAEQFDAELHVVNAVDPSMIPPEVGAESVLDALRESGRGAVDELHDRGDEAGAAIESAVLDGHPQSAILQYVEDHDVDLVVMGTHGRTGLGRWLLGSVTERIVRTCPVPVLTVREPEEE